MSDNVFPSAIISALEEAFLKGASKFKISGIDNLFNEFWTENRNFYGYVEEKNYIQRRVTSEETRKTSGDNELCRESIFTAADHVTPYSDLIPLWFEMTSWIAFIAKKHFKFPYTIRNACGIHNYEKATEKSTGLHAHYDCNLITVLKTNEPVNSEIGDFICGEDEVIIFLGATMKEFNKDANILLHWVESPKPTKRSIGSFFEADNSEKLISWRREGMTVGEFQQAYFTKDTQVYNDYYVKK
jgi:hypothetical protein